MEFNIHRILYFHKENSIFCILDAERISKCQSSLIVQSLYGFFELITMGSIFRSTTSCNHWYRQLRSLGDTGLSLRLSLF